MRTLITGVTGCVGRAVAEDCLARSIPITALVRPGSSSDLLDRPGVTVVRGELRDTAALKPALDGVTAVVHCAAKVGDWGHVSEFRAVNVEALRQLLDACVPLGLTRFVQVSSLGVYAARHHHGTDESEPLPEFHIDGYTQSKVEAEKLALSYVPRVPVTVVRPGFIYGPGDRSVLPPLTDRLRKKQVMYIGGGDRLLNNTYVGNLADAIRLVQEQPAAVGQVYNITDATLVTKRQFFEAVADGLGLPRPKFNVPMWLGKAGARFMERWGKRLRFTKPPRLTQARLKFMALNLEFSIEKAKRELGYSPAVSFPEGIAQALTWFKSHQ